VSDNRPTWRKYFSEMAKWAATRATCNRGKVGCVIVRFNQVLSTGYNGSIAGEPHCTEAGCMMVEGHCVRTNHAEANAVAQAARHGINLEGAHAYVTVRPCWNCTKLLANAGVRVIYYQGDYTDVIPEQGNLKTVHLEKIS
jgi:dCMP deaminase